jgi:ABC-type nitrate/sulfonate/bicarbonate transport system permease component
VFIANKPSMGGMMQNLRDLSDATGVMALMIAIFVVGVVADGFFGRLERFVRGRWGVLES